MRNVMVLALTSAALVFVTAVGLRGAYRTTHRTRILRRVSPGDRTRRGPSVAVRLPDPPARIDVWLGRALADTDLPLASRQVWVAWLTLAVVASVVSLAIGGPGLALVAVVTVVAGPLVAARVFRGRAAARYERALPLALEAVASGFRSGASLRQAVREAAGRAGCAGDDLARAATEAEHGVPIVAALDGWAVRKSTPGVRLAVAALCLGAETGGPQARAIDAVATTLRERLGVADEVRALSAQARFSAAVIAASPLAFGVLAASADARTADFLFGTRLGVLLLLAGVALDCAGALWMARLARVEL